MENYTNEYNQGNAASTNANPGNVNPVNTTPYGNVYGNVPNRDINPQYPVNNKKSSGTGKKILVGMVVGLCVGVFAGLGFLTVTWGSNFIKNKVDFSFNPKRIIENVIPGGNAAPDFAPGEGVPDMPPSDSNASSENAEASDNQITAADIPQTEIQSGSVANDVTEVVKAVMPSVVAVNNKYVTRMSYFGQTYSQEVEAAGSGIIVGSNDNELLIATNYHVVESAEELTVTFMDDTQAPGQIKGTDADRDLAVISVLISDIDANTKDEIAIAVMGDSDALTVGESVIAIGNSLGYGQSVTTGVVSALNRTLEGAVDPETGMPQDEGYEYIQTDAAINHGNSGGALLNMRGEVIGINSIKIVVSSVEGMGYAIPISDAKPIIEELMSKETRLKVSESKQGYLGITGVSVEKEYSEVYGMPMGVYISSVSPNEGADKAGLVKGDIIVAINDEDVESMEELKKELAYYEVGTTVQITIMQGSPTGYKPKVVNVTLGAKTE